MTTQEAIEILRDTPIDIRSTREDDIHTLYATAQGMAIEALSAQLDNNSTKVDNKNDELSCSESPNRSDTIYRQDAIDAFEEHLDYLQTLNKDENPTAESKWYGVNWARNTIADLSSAQPEPLTDKEQRIFLAAMGREEEVCKEVDEECRNCREPYEDSLVRICHEITRKVKGALWTI